MVGWILVSGMALQHGLHVLGPGTILWDVVPKIILCVIFYGALLLDSKKN